MTNRETDFSNEIHLAAVEQLLKHDEVELALKLLTQVPAYYRDNPTAPLLNMRERILRSMMTPDAYAKNPKDWAHMSFIGSDATMSGTIRGQMVKNSVKDYNDKGLVPHIIDMGPGDYWIPIALTALKYDFTYEPIGVSPYALEQVIKLIGDTKFGKRKGDAPQIFLAMEIIEHLHHPSDIVTDCLRYCKIWPEVVILSTPHHNYDYNTDWDRPDGLQHLRAYTPHEFADTINKMFPMYGFQIAVERLLSAIGKRNDILHTTQDISKEDKNGT